MKTYREYAPTGFDTKGLNADGIGPEDSPDVSEWLVAPCGINRDSGILTESNWETLRAQLRNADPDGKDHFRAEFGHWACGWLAILLVRPDSTCETVAREAEDSLSDYPILSDEDYSRRETDAIAAAWERMSVRERLSAIRDSRSDASLFGARRDYPPDDSDGTLDEYLREYVQSYA